MKPMGLAGVILLAACTGSSLAPETPARLIEADAASRAELQAVVAAAMGQATVQLADDALIDDGILLIERTPRTDHLGHRLPGRDLGAPRRFQLFRAGSDCILIEGGSDRRWVLEQARCAPL
ncbi:MAG: hypothetical protein JJT88_02005 [Gammaproteobacteria bacterium]|nr:hypothetical protein [Gammaproteobacteria bacterium]